MTQIKILWADDEIDLLKPQLFFLQKKGYEVLTVSNGYDAIDVVDENNDIDVVFLDESMPGLTGLETLAKIKQHNSSLPVVMITKNEAENLMEEAIGSQIDDYLIKPVNPNQILLTLKKLMDTGRLVGEKTATAYQQDFRQILLDINSGLDFSEWVEIYKRIIDWEIKLGQADFTHLMDILSMQKKEANREFSKYIIKNYTDWIQNVNDGPVMSHQLIREKVLGNLGNGTPTVFILLDNLRYDQWKIIEPIITQIFRIEDEDYFYSILPTSTQYSRNSIFAGLLPSEIEKHYPDWWVNDTEDKGKNLYEHELLKKQLSRLSRKDLRTDYVKITKVSSAKQLSDNIFNCLDKDLTVIVYNFIDMLSHARTEMEVLKELAVDEKAYRSLTRSWFINSPLWSAIQKLAEKDVQLFITTDHGTIRVKQPSKVVGDKDTTTNLRYKLGRNLKFDKKDVLHIKDPSTAGLPKPNVSSSFIFAREDLFFLYPNNYNYYNNIYSDTFQHGGISLEEMICPIIHLRPK